MSRGLGDVYKRQVKIELTDAKSKEVVETLEVDAVLVATGRSPNSNNLNLESVGIETVKGFIPIDDQMRVKNGEEIIPGCPVKIELTDAKSKEVVETLEVDAVLVATGRSPNSNNLNLESVGIETEKGFIPIDDQMRVKNGDEIIPNIWAVGDVTGKLMLAHTAAAQGLSLIHI